MKSSLSPERKFGVVGWCLIAGFIVAWDVLTPDSLTAAFDSGCKTRVGRIVVPAIWGITTAHLFGGLPRKADPFYIALELAKNRRNRS